MVFNYNANTRAEDIIKDLDAAELNLTSFTGGKLLYAMLRNDISNSYLNGAGHKTYAFNFIRNKSIDTSIIYAQLGVWIQQGQSIVGDLRICDTTSINELNTVFVANVPSVNYQRDILRVKSAGGFNTIHVSIDGNIVNIAGTGVNGLVDTLDLLNSLAHSYKVNKPTADRKFRNSGILNV